MEQQAGQRPEAILADNGYCSERNLEYLESTDQLKQRIEGYIAMGKQKHGEHRTPCKPGPLPKGARPDLSVDGTIELERLNDVLFVGRPAFGQEEGAVGLFKLARDAGEATRVQVKLGRNSVSTVEIVSGLKAGDQVVLSDMSAWDAFDRVRLQ